jgi:hypothetical protein
VKNRPDELPCADRAQWILDKLREGSGAQAPTPTGSFEREPKQ